MAGRHGLHRPDWYVRNKEKIKAYAAKNKERILKRHKEHPEQIRQAVSRYQKNHPEKVNAKVRAWKHRVPLLKCEVCASTESLQRHHPDYSKPLQVISLCRTCHVKIHQEIRKI